MYRHVDYFWATPVTKNPHDLSCAQNRVLIAFISVRKRNSVISDVVHLFNGGLPTSGSVSCFRNLTINSVIAAFTPRFRMEKKKDE